MLFFILYSTIHLQTSSSQNPPSLACDPSNGATKALPFCQTSLQIQARVRDLIGRLTLQEKIRLLVNNAAPVERLGIRRYEWWSEALHGVSNVGPGTTFGGKFPGATSFPQVITTAAAFNSSLWEAIGRAVSDEARAMYNGGAAGLTFWSPNVNILRDPRWGRSQETPGEDPKLVAQYAVSYVKGLQGADDNTNRLKLAACCKHYTAYDLDDWKGFDRYHFDAKVSAQDMEDTYNVPFKACVVEGKVASVMCSYNKVNGKPTCADPNLLRGTIRGQWRLNGYIVSDCDSVGVMFDQQHFTTKPEDTVAATIKAGLDLDCGPFLAVHTEEAIRAGKLSEADVNNALSNTITVQMRLGLFDGAKQPYSYLGPKDVCSSAHQQLALQAAQEGIVLLKNTGRSLPLSPQRHRTIAVIGPNADATVTMIGNYAGVPCGYTTPVQGITRYSKVVHQPGCVGGVACTSNQNFGLAEIAARHSDATVIVAGLDQSIEREAKDRESLLLPGLQQELVSRVAKASRGPTVLVLMSGGPIDVSFARDDPRVSAILWAGYPGQAGGAAIADILFGAINPGGKLPMTWYPQEYVDKVPMTNMEMRASSGGYPGRTYRFYKGKVVFPFGAGHSYTRFKQSLAQAPSTFSLPLLSSSKTSSLDNNNNMTTMSSSSNLGIKVSHTNCDSLNIDLHIDVKNIGEMDGTHTVLVFSSPPNNTSNIVLPTKHLVAFEKVHVMAGAQKRVMLSINVCKHLSVVDEFRVRRIPMGKHGLHMGNDQDDDDHSLYLQVMV
ncbi:unnamed protein product [Cuscuta campestris]|uniref:Fibronectin type III-like domain-containing protein n=1 Tax=Cuscuta campestris TaxID=132261 RepID=A0A484M4Y1_9ASTE|nr:unnamed protein product [Cuscuta campestris]